MEGLPTDATVNFSDALKWVERMIKAKPHDLIMEAFGIEPAVVAIAADVSRRALRRLEKYELPEEAQQIIDERIVLAGAMSLLLMRHGNAELWRDFIEPDTDNTKGATNE
jgi:hypothetical protein